MSDASLANVLNIRDDNIIKSNSNLYGQDIIFTPSSPFKVSTSERKEITKGQSNVYGQTEIISTTSSPFKVSISEGREKTKDQIISTPSNAFQTPTNTSLKGSSDLHGKHFSHYLPTKIVVGSIIQYTPSRVPSLVWYPVCCNLDFEIS